MAVACYTEQVRMTLIHDHAFLSLAIYLVTERVDLFAQMHYGLDDKIFSLAINIYKNDNLVLLE